MKKVIGNIWTLAAAISTAIVVIPTNLETKRGGLAIMGAGLAKQAAEAFPTVQASYGAFLDANAGQRTQGDILMFNDPAQPTGLVLLATKKAWREGAHEGLMKYGLAQLARLVDENPWTTFFVPYLGAGLGGLTRERSEALIEEYLGHLDNVTLVETDEANAPSRKTTSDYPKVAAAMKGKKVVAAVGHRGDVVGYTNTAISHAVAFATNVLRREKPQVVISDGQLGWSAAVAVAAKNLHESGELDIRLVMVLPTTDHGVKWIASRDRNTLAELCEWAGKNCTLLAHDADYDKVGPTSGHSADQLAIDLVSGAGAGSAVLSLYDGVSQGGTKQALDYADSRNVRARNFFGAFRASAPVRVPVTALGFPSIPAAKAS